MIGRIVTLAGLASFLASTAWVGGAGADGMCPRQAQYSAQVAATSLPTEPTPTATAEDQALVVSEDAATETTN
ncbi:MAG: hypothetical protein EXQ94_12565 [Alphaproteobacteria bacterium]|nr:hypothetical protein [Alphaproteobacteria bacterium]